MLSPPLLLLDDTIIAYRRQKEKSGLLERKPGFFMLQPKNFLFRQTFYGLSYAFALSLSFSLFA